MTTRMKLMASAFSTVFGTALLAGCGGSDSKGDSTASSTQLAATRVVGTVATGSALVGASVGLIDSAGTSVSAAQPTTSTGAYTLDITGLKPPFYLVAVDPTGTTLPLVSVLATVPTAADSAPVAVANITPLTSAVAALLVPSGNPEDLASPSILNTVTATSIASAETKLDTVLVSLLKSYLESSTYDPIATAFSADHTKADAVIDAVHIQPAPNGLSIVSTADPATAVVLNSASDTASLVALQAPTVAPDYLSFLPALLQTCVAAGSTTQGDASCGAAIDAGYLSNGYSTFATRHPAVANGVSSFGEPQTLAFFIDGSTQKALVRLPYVLTSGATGFFFETVQKLGTPVVLPSGAQASWNIVGNQQAFDVTIRSRASRRRNLDPANATSNRYETGLLITIPTDVAPNANVYSALVSGPGLPANTRMLVPSALGSNGLQLTTTLLSTTPVSPATTRSGTTFFRWSWQPVSGSDSQYVPWSGAGYYAPTSSSITNAAIPLYSTYTVTLFDSSGGALGTSQVVNPTPPLDSSFGPDIHWRTLADSTATDFLSPGGSLAGTVASENVAWTDPTSAGIDVSSPLSSVQIETFPASGLAVSGYAQSAPIVTDGVYTVPVVAGVNTSGVQTCSSTCYFAPLTTGALRLINVTGSTNGITYADQTRYSD